MARLPEPGGDSGSWGNVLNDFLKEAHNVDGTLKSEVVGTANIADNAVTAAKFAGSGQPNGVATLDTNGQLQDQQVPDRLAIAQLNRTFVSSFVVSGEGIDPTGATESTAAIQAVINAAGAVKGKVVFPNGTFLIDNLTIPAYVTVEGVAGGQYRFGANAAADAGTVLLHKANSTNPAVTITNAASTLRNVLIHGNNAPGTGLYIAHGFEVRLDMVRVAYVAGCGIDIDGSCNTSYRDVFVDNCGSASQPMVALRAVYPLSANTVDFSGLTIERAVHAQASYLTIGDYIDTDHHVYPEFVRIINAHIEAPTDNGGVAPAVPLVLIRNVRNVDFVTPFIYGGPAALIEHDQTETTLGLALGGVRIFGGSLLGRQVSTGLQPTTLVRLTHGNNFSVSGTRFEEYSGPAITASADYGSNVYIDPTIQTSKARTSLFADGRTGVHSPFFVSGNLQASGSDSKLNLSADSCPFVPNKYYTGRGTTVTTYQTADGVMRMTMLHVGRNCFINEIGIEVTSAGSAGAVLRLGIYRMDAWAQGTATLLIDAGTVDATSIGYKYIILNQYVPVGETIMLACTLQGTPTTAPIVRAHSGSIPAVGGDSALSLSQTGAVGSSQSGVTDALPGEHTVSAADSAPRVVVRGI